MTYWTAQDLLEKYSYYHLRQSKNPKLKYQLVGKIDKIRSYIKDYNKIQNSKEWSNYLNNLKEELYKNELTFDDLRRILDKISELMYFLKLTNIEKDVPSVDRVLVDE